MPKRNATFYVERLVRSMKSGNPHKVKQLATELSAAAKPNFGKCDNALESAGYSSFTESIDKFQCIRNAIALFKD